MRTDGNPSIIQHSAAPDLIRRRPRKLGAFFSRPIGRSLAERFGID